MRRHSHLPGLLLAAAGLLSAGLLTACKVGDLTVADSGAPTTPAAAATLPPGQAGTELGELRVAADGPMTGYSRAQFGDGWATQADHCDSRADVLKVQGTGVVSHGCTVTSGHWLSLYDGVSETSPHTLDIDHLVPLGNAWVTGARAWTAAQREAFANDVTTELVAVTAHSNRSKGDEPPPAYEPPNKAEDCSYATRWIQVKVKYKLTVTSTERTALSQMLATCPAGG
jgi:hypothetical protein